MFPQICDILFGGPGLYWFVLESLSEMFYSARLTDYTEPAEDLRRPRSFSLILDSHLKGSDPC